MRVWWLCSSHPPTYERDFLVKCCLLTVTKSNTSQFWQFKIASESKWEWNGTVNPSTGSTISTAHTARAMEKHAKTNNNHENKYLTQECHLSTMTHNSTHLWTRRTICTCCRVSYESIKSRQYRICDSFTRHLNVFLRLFQRQTAPKTRIEIERRRNFGWKTRNKKQFYSHGSDAMNIWFHFVISIENVAVALAQPLFFPWRSSLSSSSSASPSSPSFVFSRFGALSLSLFSFSSLSTAAQMYLRHIQLYCRIFMNFFVVVASFVRWFFSIFIGWLVRVRRSYSIHDASKWWNQLNVIKIDLQ